MALSIAERLRAAVLTRLKEPTPVVAKVTSIRRAHPVDVTRDMAPAVYVLEGTDIATPSATKSGCPRRQLNVTVKLIVRSDAGTTAADALLLTTLARLDPATGSGYGEGVVLALGTISPDQDVADKDVVALDIELLFTYATTSEFNLASE